MPSAATYSYPQGSLSSANIQISAARPRLPLTIGQATEQCLHLRLCGWTWTQIARTMTEYHACPGTTSGWRARALTMAPYYGVDPDELKHPLTPNKAAALRRLNTGRAKLELVK